MSKILARAVAVVYPVRFSSYLLTRGKKRSHGNVCSPSQSANQFSLDHVNVR